MKSVYNDIGSHWCGHSYDCLCWDDYTSEEVKTKGSLEVGEKSFMVVRFGYIGPRRLLCSFSCVMLFFVHVSSLSC